MGLNIVLNVLLSLLFIRTGWERPLAGVALATSLSSAANLVALRIAMRRRLGRGGGAPVRAWAATLPASAACLGLLVLLKPRVAGMCSGGFLPGLIALGVAAVSSMACFLIVFALAGGAGVATLRRFVFRRGREDLS